LPLKDWLHCEVADIGYFVDHRHNHVHKAQRLQIFLMQDVL